jgi:predicted permease
VQDVRFACRLLRRAPAFTAAAVVVLALGVGLNLAAFQIIDMLALSWLPVRSPQTLINLHRRTPQSVTTTFSYPAFDFYRQNRSTVEDGVALVGGSVVLGDKENRTVYAKFVTTNYFSTLGAVPRAGRLLDARDDEANAEAAVVVGERLWKANFGSDTAAIGRRVHVNGQPFTLVGIVPETFVGVDGSSGAAWIPISHHRFAFPGSTLLQDWDGESVQFYARLRDGATPAAAEAELRAAVDGLRLIRPDHARENEWLAIRPAGRYVSFEEALPAFALITALVGLILVAACMNLGLLVLARTLSRDREFAIRLSVGATRGRIVRQLITEHVVLGALGASAGCFVAVLSGRALRAMLGIPAGLMPQFSLRTVVVAAVLAVISSVLFGFAPAWQALRPAAARRLRLRSVLVGVQVAAASALLIVSGLLVRGVTRVVRVPLGFEYQQTLVADADLASRGMTPAAAQAYWRDVDDRVRHVPAVRNVALTSLAPFGNRVAINGERTVFYQVTPSYFDTMRIAVERGRVFRDDEADVVLISHTLARRRWPGEDPIGKIYNGATVVGVVSDARTVKFGERSATECYSPFEPKEFVNAVMVVRVEGPARDAAPAVRSVMRANDPRLMPAVVPLQEALEEQLQAPRQAALVTAALGVCALLLAVTGLGGMVAFTVSQRLREIGVRVALGARPAHVVRAIARQFTTPVVCGALAGSALAAAAGTVLSREMFGVSQLDPLAHGGAFLLFALVAAVAALPSVRRALRVDPAQSLRHE